MLFFSDIRTEISIRMKTTYKNNRVELLFTAKYLSLFFAISAEIQARQSKPLMSRYCASGISVTVPLTLAPPKDSDAGRAPGTVRGLARDRGTPAPVHSRLGHRMDLKSVVNRL